jgi:hypothetical protein
MARLTLQYVPGINGPGFYTIARDEATFQLLEDDDEHPYISPAKKIYYTVKAICLGPFNKY